jgi:hypothetical protein
VFDTYPISRNLPMLKVHINAMAKSEFKNSKKKIEFCMKKFNGYWISSYKSYLYAPFNMGRVLLDRACTKHVVYIRGQHSRFGSTSVCRTTKPTWSNYCTALIYFTGFTWLTAKWSKVFAFSQTFIQVTPIGIYSIFDVLYYIGFTAQLCRLMSAYLRVKLP